jgi:O-antigen ligase
MRQNMIHPGHVLGVAGLLAPTAGIFAPMMVTPIALLALLGLTLLAFRQASAFRSDRPLIVTICLILGWSAISLFWTINLSDAFLKCASIVGFGSLAVVALLFGPQMVEHERHALRRFILLGMGLGLLFFFFEVVTDGAISRHLLGKISTSGSVLTMFGLAPSVLLMFIWPSVTILWRSWPPVALALIVLGGIAAYLLPSASAMIGYTIGDAIFFIALIASRGASLFIAAIVALVILAGPFIPRVAPALDPAAIREMSNSENPSFLHRLDIWAFTIRKIEERPLVGWGFNASRTVPDGDAHYYLRDRSGRVIGQGNRLPLHPHNGALQVWLELGLPGAIGIAALFAIAALRSDRQTDPAGKAGALAAIATAAPIWMLSFGIWQTWWLSVLVLTALLTVSLIAPERT